MTFAHPDCFLLVFEKEGESVALCIAAPWADTPLSYIPVQLGANVNITCQYDAEPMPMLDWLFNSFPLNVREKEWEKKREGSRVIPASRVSVRRT